MKIVLTVFGALLITSVTIMGCNSSPNNTEDQLQKEGNVKVSAEQSKTNDKNESENKVIKEASIVCKIYFENSDVYDEETGELIQKATIDERKSFWSKKEYTFCYDSEDFKKIILSGTGENLSFSVYSGKKQIFNKSNIILTDKLTFTPSEFSFEPGEKYSIEVKQGEKVLFNGKIDSQGCM